jgi:hypothetical protein
MHECNAHMCCLSICDLKSWDITLIAASYSVRVSATVRLPRPKPLAARIPGRPLDMVQSREEGKGGEQREVGYEI